MRWWRMAVMLTLAGLVPATTRAKGLEWHASVAAEEAYNDNVQQHSAPNRDGDFITTLTAAAGWEKRPRGWLPSEFTLWTQGHTYQHFGAFDYVEIRPEGSYPLLFNTDFVLGYLFSPRRLLFEEEASDSRVFYREHVLTTGLRGKYGTNKQLRTQLLFRGTWDGYFGVDRDRDAWIPALEWDLGYRFPVWNSGVDFTPRVGVRYAKRYARRDNFDRDAIHVVPGFDLRLPAGIMIRFRYERVRREYTVDAANDASDQRNNNFMRLDDYEQFHTGLTIPLPFREGLALRPRYRFRHGVFDEPNRKDAQGHSGVQETFDVHETGLEVLYAF